MCPRLGHDFFLMKEQSFFCLLQNMESEIFVSLRKIADNNLNLVHGMIITL